MNKDKPMSFEEYANPMRKSIYNTICELSLKLKQIEEANNEEKLAENPNLPSYKLIRKEPCAVGISIWQYYEATTIKNRNIHIVPTNTFIDLIIQATLYRIAKCYSQYFGTGDAKDVLTGIYETYYKPKGLKYDIFENDFLRSEKFAYIVEWKDDKVCEKILRLDFYRLLGVNTCDSEKYECIGGILHALKHFNIKGVRVSYGTGEVEIDSLCSFIELIIKAFFDNEWIKDGDYNYVSHINYDDRHILKFVFFHNIEADVYFLKTVHLESK